LLTASLAAEQPKPTDYQVKAAYLYNFGKFISWPNQPEAASGSDFHICVLGQDPFGAALDTTLRGQTLNGKNVTARRLVRDQDVADRAVLFISSSEEDQLRKILAALDMTPVLTVSDMPEFSRVGVMIEFVLSENRVRFVVNVAAAERSGLNMNSQLLKVAVRVRGKGPGD